MEELFEKQKTFQEYLGCEVKDNPEWFSYHVVALIEELGELLKTDKRWKITRNTNYNIEEKREELADVFITVANIALFSGLNCEQVLEDINKKISKNYSNVKKAKEAENACNS